MKKKHILLFTISLLTLIQVGFSQNDTIKKDTVKIKKIYGLRIGLDVSNPIRRLINKNRKAFEVTADFRVKPNLYIATEVGYLDQFLEETKYDFQTKGNYAKLGLNYNFYKNWLDMDNEIYVGLRYGYSNFSQTVSNIIIDSENSLPPLVIATPTTYDNLNAGWLEFVIGIKAEIYKNLYLGFQLSGNK
ncbi:MAG TPA: hypothetical protein ENK67_04485, partial [Flavobacteriia bacterium]|nr:hypothetical protein [Flavobacteriia bacterium]